jgi:hypothetical protein
MSDTMLSSKRAIGEEESSVSAVSWAAVLAGAFVASAFSIALVALGAGIGLVSISPWSNNNASVTTFGILAAVWLIAVQLFSSGIGGYLAGRLRTRWAGIHSHEVYFRDTAHGLLVWGVGAVISAMLLSSAVSSAVSGASRLGETAAQAVGSAASLPAAQLTGQTASNSDAYFTDMLFRTDHPSTSVDQNASQAEIGRIFARALGSGDLSAADRTYVAQVVASRTGLSQADADRRVSDTFGQAKNAAAQGAEKAKEAADAARKTGVYVALWMFLSLLVGAFSACYMATVGGEARDDQQALI